VDTYEYREEKSALEIKETLSACQYCGKSNPRDQNKSKKPQKALKGKEAVLQFNKEKAKLRCRDR